MFERVIELNGEFSIVFSYRVHFMGEWPPRHQNPVAGRIGARMGMLRDELQFIATFKEYRDEVAHTDFEGLLIPAIHRAGIIESHC